MQDMSQTFMGILLVHIRSHDQETVLPLADTLDVWIFAIWDTSFSIAYAKKPKYPSRSDQKSLKKSFFDTF